jgi:riboflavin synthase
VFTGIVHEVGEIKDVTSCDTGIRLGVGCDFKNLQLGESISVDGTCLTVTETTSHGFLCDISPETLNLTLSRQYQPGTRVNLERALCMGDRMGGHWVTGHVDGLVKVSEKQIYQDFWKLTFTGLRSELVQTLIKKGSISINGVSLTLNEVTETGFEVMLVPHTLERTNLKLLELGNIANCETDWMGKMIVQTVSKMVGANHVAV